MRAITCIVLDKRRKRKSGKYPVKLRLTFKRKQTYYATEYEFLPDQFEKVMGASPKGKHKDIRLALNVLEQKANDIINKLGLFDITRFEKLLYSDQQVYQDVYPYYEHRISLLKQSGDLGTASNYKCSLNSLKQYRPKLTFAEITVDFLRGYEKWMIKAEKSPTTVGIYLRPLRAIINLALAEGVLPGDFVNPFGAKSKHQFKIPASRNIKKALGNDALKKIFEYTPESGSWEQRAYDYWIFIYLANGINVKDLANLKWNNIDEDYIRFIREKTKKTSSNSLPISVYMQEKMKAIINRQGNPRNGSSAFIFPIIAEMDSLERQRGKIQQMTKMINKHMKQIAQELEIGKDITTYTARHSFSTRLKRSGVSIHSISEALGHTSVSTTKAYLDSFDDESKKEMAKLLTNFE
jgi:integrase/recombinase XerD